MFMQLTAQVTYIFTPIVSLKDSLSHRGKSKLGIGLFIHELLREPLIDLSKPFTLSYHLQYRADAIVKEIPSFHDHSIINDTDLNALFSQNSIEKK